MWRTFKITKQLQLNVFLKYKSILFI